MAVNPISLSGYFDITVSFETNEIEARASPLKPKEVKFVKSWTELILLVANRSHRSGKSSFIIPEPLSAIFIY